jgi:hypothetical protein
MSEPTTRDELLTLERERWHTLERLLEAVPGPRTTEPSLTREGWSVRDLVWHLACWNEVVREELEKMRLGTFDEGFDCRDVVLAMERLEDVSPRAIELFSEPAYRHVNDHLPELLRFLGVDERGAS